MNAQGRRFTSRSFAFRAPWGFSPRLPRRRLVALSVALVCGIVRGAPIVTRAPVDLEVPAGRNATFTVAATGTGALNYQWRRSGFALPGATTATFVVGGATRGDAGVYDVLVSDTTGSVAAGPARLRVAPSAYPTNLLPDPALDPQIEWTPGLAVYAVAALPDGGFLAGGHLASVNGVRHNLIVRVKADGTVDETFAPTIAGDEIRSIVRLPDGKILIAGLFEQVNGYRRHDLARLNADGSLDLSFAPLLPDVNRVRRLRVQSDGKLVLACEGGPMVRRLNADGTTDPRWSGYWNGSASDLALQADGKVVVVGLANSGTEPYFVVRFTGEGLPDSTFKPGRISGYLQAVAVDGAGGVLVGGYVTAIGDRGVAGIARLLPDGSVDSSFNATVTSSGFASDLYTIAVQPDGKILVGGGFQEANGAMRPYLARLQATGALDAFMPPNLRSRVLAIATATDGSVVVGTEGVADDPLRVGVARISDSGLLDLRLNLTMRAPGGTGPVIPLPGGKFMLFGRFEVARGLVSQGVIRLNADATVDRSFALRTGGLTGYDAIAAAAALPDGRIAVTGAFSSYATIPRRNIAVLHADGSLDLSFSPGTHRIDGGEAVAVTPDGKFVVGGMAYRPGGGLVEGAVTKFNLDGSVDRAFDSAGGFDGEVRCLLVQADGRVLVGGMFAQYNGRPTPALARLNRDGSLDSTFQADLPPGAPVDAMAFSPSGKIVVGYGYGLTRLLADGAKDTTWVSSTSGGMGAVLVQEDERVIVRSWSPLSIGDGVALARLNADGSYDSTFRSSGIYPSVYAGVRPTLLQRDDGQLLISDGGAAVGRFFATRATSAPVITRAPVPQILAPGASATLAVAATSDVPTMYQWFLNGTPIAGATDAGYTLTGFAPAQVGSYAVAVTSEFGTVKTGAVTIDALPYTSARLVNLSVRTATGTGDATLIVGVVLGGAGTAGNKPLLFRAVGPTLTGFHVAGALADPMLELYNAADFKIDQNDDWGGVFDFASVGAFGFAGTPVRDAAVYNPYATTGSQTMHVLGKNGAGGIALAEIYDASVPSLPNVFTPRLINGSARTQVGTGEGVLILGFAISGEGTERVLVRAVGPTLAGAPYRVAGTLADPRLEIYDANQTIVAANDNWEDSGANLGPAFTAVGAFTLATGSKDSALITTLAPGSYTAVVRGTGTGTGVALVEIYEYK